VSWRRRFTDGWGHPCTQTTILLGCVVLCALSYSACHEARADVRVIRATVSSQRELLAAIAGQTRSPLKAEWVAADGLRYTVVVTWEPGWTDEQYQDVFDRAVERNRKRHPPAAGQ